MPQRQFRPAPRPPAPDKVAEFAAGARERELPTQTREAESPALTGDLDPNGKPTRAMTLRLNEYESQILREAAARERRSIANLIKSLAVEGALDLLRR